MIVFEKNGQGKWDYDLTELEKVSNVEFVTRIENTLKFLELVERELELFEYETYAEYVSVYIAVDNRLINFTFDNIILDIKEYQFPRWVAEQMLKNIEIKNREGVK